MSGPTICIGETGGEGEPARVSGGHLQAQAGTNFCHVRNFIHVHQSGEIQAQTEHRV